MRVLGVDLAWGEGASAGTNETGVVAVDRPARILDAGWAAASTRPRRGWRPGRRRHDRDGRRPARRLQPDRACGRASGGRTALRPLEGLGQRLQPRPSGAGRRRSLPALAADGWRCADGRDGPPHAGRWLYEVFLYTTLVGAAELGYDAERPVYKRRPRLLTPAAFRRSGLPTRDELVRRLDGLRHADPPIDLRSHPATAALRDEPTPLADRAVKHREDLIDAVLCAWTGLLWLRHGLARCQVLGGDDVPGPDGSVATILAPARPSQRLGFCP